MAAEQGPRGGAAINHEPLRRATAATIEHGRRCKRFSTLTATATGASVNIRNGNTRTDHASRNWQQRRRPALRPARGLDQSSEICQMTLCLSTHQCNSCRTRSASSPICSDAPAPPAAPSKPAPRPIRAANPLPRYTALGVPDNMDVTGFLQRFPPQPATIAARSSRRS